MPQKHVVSFIPSLGPYSSINYWHIVVVAMLVSIYLLLLWLKVVSS